MSRVWFFLLNFFQIALDASNSSGYYYIMYGAHHYGTHINELNFLGVDQLQIWILQKWHRHFVKDVLS